ncbi:hypothetical protein Phum_PHUM456170 [Pediculus humanus corporis]|uniref:Uncharacterized protein n=1 Tax=Pediculus humanus subsp. corporis TaxID=121224 RepID=E0VUW5_PEDHC|nr:uncharacterized protein Phum_PHUM456170 [Pediculus humanus corporis]EEB17171.1 hypothetical protein Phum_PHUM456170 [Pediculus humanus corporis]
MKGGKERKELVEIKSLEVFTQTANLINATDLSNLTLQNVNVIVDQSFSNHPHQILLTSIEGLINSNSVPVIMTQNLSET